MELSVLLQQVSGNGYRASCGGPLVAIAEGATRDEALAKLRADLEARTSASDEIVCLTIHPTRAVSKELAKRIARADAEPGTSIPLEQLRAELLQEAK